MNTVPLLYFCGQKKFVQIRFTLRRMQYMAQMLYEANSLRSV